MRPALSRFRFVALIMLMLIAALLLKVVRPLASPNVTSAVATASLAANTLYVATAGSDASNNCLNSLSPCASLGYAATQAASGDTIQLAAGIYTKAGISIMDKTLTIQGAGTAVTILQAAASAGIATDRVLRLADTISPIADVSYTLQDLTIRYGVSPSGGGINIALSQVTLNNVAVTDNRAMDLGGSNGLNGGGISINGGSLTLNNSTVSGNSVATSDALTNRGNGGGIFTGSATPVTLNNSTVSGNSAVRSGGGIYSLNNTVNLNYSTVANNTSDSDNDAVGDGGGVSRGSGTINLKSSIVAGNRKGTSGTASATADCGGTAISRNYNLTGSGTGCSLSGTGDQTVTPSNVFTAVLGPLADNGGPTRTHALLGGSPALNQIPNGVNDCGLSPFNLDQRGGSRPYNNSCDMGAFEARTLRMVTTAGSDSGDCSLAACASLGYAAAQVMSGDTIQLAAGIYTEAGISIMDKTLTIQGAGTAVTILQAAASAGIATDRVLRLADTISPIADVSYTLQDLTIRYGVSPSGGGINIVQSQVTLNNVAVTDNRTMDVSGSNGLNGGGISINIGSLTLNNSTVSGNSVTTSDGLTARGNGGGIFVGSATPLTLNNSTVSGNSAVRSGGGIYSLNNTVNLNYSTVANNTSDSDNDSVGDGGGVSRGTATINLKSSIVAGNRKGTSGTASATADCGGTAVSRNYNLTGSGTGCSLSGTGDQTVTPSNVFTAVLGPLADNGGPTRTHALLGGSLALNRIPNGVNDCGLSSFNQDQRGKTRAIDTNCEIGAYEAQISILRDSASLTNASSVSWTVTFGDAVSNLSSSNFALAVAGLGGTPTITGATPIGGAPATQWTVTASTGSGVGTLGLNMTNSTAISPAVSDVPYTGPIYSIDTVRPTVAINQAAGQADPALASPVNFIVVFSKSVTGFTTGDVNLSGAAGATTATVSEIAPNNGTTYNVAVTGMATSGTVSASIAENAASDAAGNGNLASTSTDNTVIFINCLSSLTVNDLGDTADASAGNGVCADSKGNCTLRAAVQEANALTACSSLTINFSVTGTISLATALPNLNHPNLTISGPGAASLTVQRSTASGTANFRIFSISSGKTVAISGLTIANGYVSADGGGITNFGSLTITGCAIRDNYANGGGGILNFAILNMSNSTLSGNSAGFDGAGMYNINGTASLTNCTISANTSVGGGSGGIVSLAYSGFSASLSLTNCTVTGNSGSKIIDVFIYPGGIASTAQLRNTLVAGNSGKNFEFPGTTQVTSLGNNLDSDGTSGFINGANGNQVGTATRKINALLSPLGNYGGTTQTHALLPGSPAINAGTSSGAPTSDQRGSSRVGAVDIGAFESQGFTLAITSGNSQSAVVNTAFASPLAVMVAANVATEPVNGGQVIFTPPVSGASAVVAGSPATVANGAATSGTVTANSRTGNYNVSASANGASPVSFSLTNGCQTITVTAPATNTGTAGTAFSQQFTQMGGIGAVTFSTMSTLPTGLALSTEGVLSGTPAQTGAFPITVKVSDANGCMGMVGYTLTINCQTINIGPGSIASGNPGVGYSQQFTQMGGIGSVTFSTSSALPTGITLNGGGLLAGTTTQTGSFPLIIKVTDSNGCIGAANYTLAIGCPAITVVPPVATTGTAGTMFSQSFTQTGGTAGTTFSTASVLPAGLTLSSAGLLSGIPAQSGLFPITVTASSSGGCTGSASYMLTINCPAITLSPTSATPPAPLSAQAGIAYSQTITAAPAGTGYAFAVTAGALPSGLTLNPNTGLISGTTNLVGVFTFTVTATGWGACTSSQQYKLTVGCPAVTLSSLPGGAAGTAYSQTLTASPAGGGYSFAVTTGSLPPGLSLAAGGALTGTPTQAGTFSFTVTATGFGGCPGAQAYSLAIACPAVALSPATLPNAAANMAYSQTISATPSGTTYSFAVTSGTLPAGLSLAASGAITGSPTQSGTFNFRITATGFGSCTGFRDYALVVGCASVTVNPATLPGGTMGTAYNQSVSATPAGTYSFSVTGGTLPNGLTLNAGTGAITGTPTASGSFTFTITASAGSCSGASSYTVAIGCQGISFTTTSLPVGTAGSNYAQSLTVTPSGTYTFSLTQGNLPNGLTLIATTGVISGLPSVSGTYGFTVKAQTATGCSATQAYSLTVNCPAVAVSPATLPNGTTGTAYSQTLSATPAGGSYSFAVTSGGLPTGLSLNSSTGVLSGTPAVKGSFNFTITATGFGSCAGSKSYSITIGGGCPAITLPDLPNGSPGQPYNNSVAASPSGAYSYEVTAGSLPPGVVFYSAAALLSGYPTAAGAYNFTITATDANNCTGSKSYTVMIGGGALSRAAAVNDFSGDRKSDFALWRASQGQWVIVNSATDATQTTQWGQAGGVAVAGDYDGDGKTDLAVFGKDGHWLIKASKDGKTMDTFWGLGTDVPVPGDYDGDGKTDIAVWRGAETTWYILRSSDGQRQTVQWGSSLAPYFDVPAPGDYDGDGKTDVAVFRRANGHWYIRRSSDGQTADRHWGLGTDVPVPGDYDGDGKTDIAVWRGAEGVWYIVRSSDGAVETKLLGSSAAPYNDAPVPGDYDGDGKTDLAVWRKAEERWYVLQSTDGATRVAAQGKSDDATATAQPRP